MIVFAGAVFFLGLFGLNVLYAQGLRIVLGSERYDAFTESPARAASVGVNYHGLRFLNAVILAVFGLISTVVFPGYGKVFGVLCGIGIYLFAGYFVGALVVAAVLGWLLS